MKPRKILYVGGFKLPDKNSSAIRALSIARLINDLGYQVELGGKYENKDASYPDLKFWNIENFRGIKNNQDYEIKSIIEKVNFEGIENIKAIIAYNYAPLAYFKMHHYCKKKNIPLIQDITEWYGIDGNITIQKLIRLMLTNLRIGYFGYKTKNLIVSVDFLKKKFHQANCITLPQISLHQESSKNTNYLHKGDIIKFIYVGSPGQNFSKEKVDWAIEIFHKLEKKYDNFTFEIIGIEMDYFLKYPQLKFYLENSKKISVHGRKKHSYVIEKLKSSHFLIFFRPNTRVSKVGFPTKIKEAFDIGVGVITNDTGDISKYVKNEDNGFIIKSFNKTKIEEELNIILSLDYELLNLRLKQLRQKNPFLGENFRNSLNEFLKAV